MRSSLILSLVAAAAIFAGPAAPAVNLSVIEDGLLQRTGPVNVIARFERSVPQIDVSGVTVLYGFRSVPAVYARADGIEALRALASLRGLAYLEADKAIGFDLDSATIASRARDVWAPPEGEPLRDAEGRVIDGTGVGIAVVDTGLDGLHPDYQRPGKVGGNYQVTPAGLVSGTYTSNINSAHGTHVAGIAVGEGTLSGGVYRGAAPGATLYSFNMFAGVDGTIVLPAIAFDWILQEGHKQDPPIRVVNNSWRCIPRVCHNAFNPDQIHTHLASKLAESGIVVTWSAGNDGGDGTAALTNPESRNPTPGIIGVANYKDERTSFDTGVRDNRVSGTSSRGDSRDPTTWPDVAAPGRHVFSTWAVGVQVDDGRLVGRNPVTGENSYYLLNGTSMAAPHVAGIAALMLQANPSLTPGEVEYIVKATADKLPNPIGYVRADPSHPYDGSNYADGHGLVDAHDAVLTSIGFAGIPDAPAPEEIPESFWVSVPAIEVDETLYLTNEMRLSPTEPASPPAPTYQRLYNYLTYESAPAEAAITLDAVYADLFLGSLHEYGATTHASLRFRVVVERVDAAGARSELGSATDHTWSTPPLSPIHRRFQVFLPQVETISSGERIAVSVILEKRPGASPALVSDFTLTEGGFVVYTGRPALSRIGLGRVVTHPERGSDIGCRAREYCAVIGGEAEIASLTCGAAPTRLRWSGPAGSALIFSCDETTTVCQVPGKPGDPPGECEMELEPIHPYIVPARDGQCAYRTPDGERAGQGRCEILTYLKGRS